MTVTPRLSLLMVGLLALLLAGCSDDSETEDPDTGVDSAVADKGPALDKKAGEAGKDGAADAADAAQPDVGPDMIRPDTVQTSNKYWEEMKYPASERVMDIAGVDSKNIYAVGGGGTLLKYNGAAWSKETNPDTNKTGLTSLWLTSTASYWYAIGSGIILYYNGNKWYKGYYSTYSNYSYNDVWAKSDPTLWAVGDAGMVYRKTSTSPSGSFSYLTSAGMGGKENFNGIWGVSDSDLWVVGDKGAIYHCSSTCTTVSGWKKVASGVTYNLRDIHGFKKDDIWAVGYNGTVLYYDGTGWTKKGPTGTKSYFNAVHGTSSKDLFVVGHPVFNNDESAYHYDGTTWTKISPPRISYLNAVYSDGKGLTIAVGNFNILKYKGSK